MESPGAWHAIRAVVIDDSALFLAGSNALLSQFARLQSVDCADSGPAGLALIERLAPDLVLVDLVMPGMSGLEVCSLIPRTDGLPRVVLMSGHHGTEFTNAALEAGADAFVHKRYLYEELIRLTNEWFGAGEPGVQ